MNDISGCWTRIRAPIDESRDAAFRIRSETVCTVAFRHRLDPALATPTHDEKRELRLRPIANLAHMIRREGRIPEGSRVGVRISAFQISGFSCPFELKFEV